MEEERIGIEDLIEVTFEEDDDFLKIKETLTRMGVSSRKEKKLYQSCHILHKRGKYYIVHFKELFSLDGLPSTITDSDIARRNTIASLLEEWGLLEIVDIAMVDELQSGVKSIKIIPHREKDEWELIPKYHIGKK